MRQEGLPARMDFQTEVISVTESGEFQMRFIPDPRRYEKISGQSEGETLYVDKYFGHAIPLRALVEGDWDGLPVYYRPPLIKSVGDYVRERELAVGETLRSGSFVPPSQMPDCHTTIQPHSALMAFVSVDVCGSSALRSQNAAQYDRSFETMIMELGTSLGHFHAQIFKTTGDGFIAYLDEPSFTTMSDNTVDLCLTLAGLMQNSVNPGLQAANLPPLQIRIGADAGQSIAKKISIPSTGFELTDISSDALNRAVKIQEAAPSGKVAIGFALYSLLHVQWLERCKPMDFDGISVGIPDYLAFDVA